MKQPFELPSSLIKYQAPIPISTQQLNASQHQTQLKPTLRNILNALIPPRTISHNKKTYIQYVDQSRPQRQTVDLLKEKLQGSLKVLKAANQPICPIREKLFVEAFDEIIRQVTIDCSERGVMLSRVKNELMMTVVGYRTMYEEAVGWGKGKLGEGELEKSEQQEKELIKRQNELQEKRVYLESKRQSLEQKQRQLRTIYQEKRQQQLSQLKFQQQQLLQFLRPLRRIKQQEARELEKQKQEANRAQARIQDSDDEK